MKVKTEKRCGCRDEAGKQLGKACPLLRRQGHGAWSYRLRVPDELVSLVGKQYLRGSGYPTAKKAEEAGQEELNKVGAGQQAIGQLSVGTYLEQWLAGKRRLKPSSARSYGSHIRVHINPIIGTIPLASLQPDHITQAYRRIEDSNENKQRATGPGTITRIHATLRTALNDAVKTRKIQFNPAASVELPTHRAADIEPWEAIEVGRFLDEASDDRLSALYELIALHGVRRGEACGATWTGLDASQSVLTIRQQITENGGRLGVWAPKTKSGRRKVDLDSVTLGALVAHQIRQDAERELIGEGWDNGILPDDHGKPVQLSDLIFTRPDGRHLDPQFVTKHMQVIARRVGLCAAVSEDAEAGSLVARVGRRHAAPEGRWLVYRDREPIGEVTVVKCVRRRGSGAELTFAARLEFDLRAGDELGRDLLSRRRLHDLRHSSASIQLGAGVDITLVSKRLGHSSTTITGTLYTHLLRSTGQAAAETISRAIPRAHGVPTTITEGSGRGESN